MHQSQSSGDLNIEYVSPLLLSPGIQWTLFLGTPCWQVWPHVWVPGSVMGERRWCLIWSRLFRSDSFLPSVLAEDGKGVGQVEPADKRKWIPESLCGRKLPTRPEQLPQTTQQKIKL